MHWNYRVVRQKGVHDGTPWVYYAIHEAYYRGKQVSAITKDPVDVGSETLKGLPDILKKMARATRQPTLDYETRKEINMTKDQKLAEEDGGQGGRLRSAGGLAVKLGLYKKPKKGRKNAKHS